VGAIQKRVVVINDAIAIRPMAYISLTFDHRILDGAIADYFWQRCRDVGKMGITKNRDSRMESSKIGSDKMRDSRFFSNLDLHSLFSLQGDIMSDYDVIIIGAGPGDMYVLSALPSWA